MREAAGVVCAVGATALAGLLAHAFGAGAVGATFIAVFVGAAVGFLCAWRVQRHANERLARLEEAVAGIGGREKAVSFGRAGQDAMGAVEDAVGATGARVATTIRDLRREQDRLQAILRGMLEGVVVTDLDGRVVLSNAPAQALLDVSPEVLGRHPLLVEIARAPAFVEIMRELQAGARMVSRDVRLQGPGEPTVQMNAAELRADDGTAFGYVVVLHDVTELRRLEVVRRDFVANVSHELRTPLTAIKGYAETLLGDAGNDRDTAKRFLRVIDRHSERLGRLIDDLLTLSDLELGRSPLNTSEVDVAAAVDDVMQIFAEQSSRKRLRLVANVTGDVATVHADGDRLRQVLINLVDNAVKYTPENGLVTVHVASVQEAGERMLRLAVEDSGPGIPARDLTRLTERFFRVDKARSRELGGTGLGLAIVKHIVQLHGGRLEIRSAVGQGTTVSVFLPAGEATPGLEAAQG
jgi:two-component system phosphate regulon sensor histidine kinase PhoR